MQPRTRFIPAGAGNSSRAIAIAIVRSVYPRWRGELYINEVNLWKLYGLSPLARRTLFMRGSKSPRRRFIPAGAGNSNRLFVFPIFMTVYPRWRGELCIKTSVKNFAVGLSPLARGTRTRDAPRFVGTRFIPAGAGNSIDCWVILENVAVYPRWRGELM